jgi:hypothetical protein
MATADIGSFEMATVRRAAADTAVRSELPRRRNRKLTIASVVCLAGSFIVPMVGAAPPASADTVNATPVRTVLLSSLDPPIPDPSGIAWDAAANRLLIADSEVEEMPIFDAANLWDLTLEGTLNNTGDLTPPAPGFTNEPTGLSFDPVNGHLFVSDDFQDTVFQLAPGDDGGFGTADDTIVSSIRVSDFGNTDPEDVAYDPESGDLFTADGVGREVYRISPGLNGVFDGVPPTGDDAATHFDTAVFGSDGSEGLAYDPVRNTLLVVDPGTKQIFETTKSGALLNTIDLAAVNPRHAEDVVLAPAFADPAQTNMYLVARGVDNDSDPDENDGKMFEVSVSLPPVGNMAPEVHAGTDQTITLPDSATLSGSVTDDDLPAGATVTTLWAAISGPGTVTFGDETSPSTTASFSVPGTYTLRLTADDTELQADDDVVITVNPEGLVEMDIPITAGTDDAEEKVTGVVNRGSSLLDLGVLSGVTQTVGLRFTSGVSALQGATISSAYVQFQAKKTTVPVSLRVEGQASDVQAGFTAQAFNISSRPRTAAGADWTPDPWQVANEVGPKQRTPELATVLQEIIDLPGWDGTALVLIISHVSGTGRRGAVSFNGSGQEPVLHVEFTAS